MIERRVRLFRDGRNQVVHIPREFELPGTEAILRLDEGRLILQAAEPDALVAALNRLEFLDEEWPDIEDPLPEPVSI